MHLKDDELVAALGDHADVPALLVATYARVVTAVSFTRMLTPLGNYLIARPAARAAAHHITAETDVPLDAMVVLGLSADALHIWSADPMLDQVGEYLGLVPAGADHGDAGLARPELAGADYHARRRPRDQLGSPGREPHPGRRL